MAVKPSLKPFVDDPDCRDAEKSSENFASCPETSYKELKPSRDAGKSPENFASCPGTSYKELKPSRDAEKSSENFASCPEKVTSLTSLRGVRRATWQSVTIKMK